MGTESPSGDLTELLEVVADGGSLTVQQAETAIDAFMAGAASEAQMAGLLIGLRAKGIDPAEVAGGVRALRKAMIPVAHDAPHTLVDTAGTGGGSVTTFNISTAAALVVAGAGVPVAKHGNRSFTSRCGSADVLEALGVCIDLPPGRMADVLAEAGIVFMYAPLLHPAMRHVGAVRRALGVTTMMNILGPLTNPAGARRQVVGVADPRLLDLVPQALAELGHLHALVVHGEPGMDEVSPAGATRVAEVRDGVIERYEITPEDLGLRIHALDELAGGDPDDNAALIERILGGERGATRDAVVLNAAAALRVSGAVESWEDAARRAEEVLDGGGGADALERLRNATNEDG